jgi:hypothetical protein
MAKLGFTFILISIFGWFGFWFAGSGHAFLIALGFFIAGILLISAGEAIDNLKNKLKKK